MSTVGMNSTELAIAKQECIAAYEGEMATIIRLEALVTDPEELRKLFHRRDMVRMQLLYLNGHPKPENKKRRERSW
jgi:hypothetical protein